MFDALDAYIRFLTSMEFEQFISMFWHFLVFEFSKYVLLAGMVILWYIYQRPTIKRQEEIARTKLYREYPLISVIVPGKNEGPNIYKLAKSLKSQTYQNYELIIVDDGSDDDITLAFEKFIEHMQVHFEHEQGLMKHQGYTMANVHEGEHYKVINEARYNLQNWRNFKDRWDLKEYFGEDFVAWLNQHIEAMDKPMVDFFKSEGVL